MNNDIIRSMKDQMVPSDECIDDLLAKIACLGAPGTATNTVTFEPVSKPAEIGAAAAVTTGRKITTKKIWTYGTAIAASLIVMVSAVSMFGSDPSEVQANLDNIVSAPDSVLVSETSDTQSQTPAEPSENITEENIASDAEVQPSLPAAAESKPAPQVKEDKPAVQTPSEDADNAPAVENGQDDKTPVTAQSVVQKSSNEAPAQITEPEKAPSDKPARPERPAAVEGSNGNTAQPSDENKVTPGETAGELAWTKEILAAGSIEQLTIQGTNYLVTDVTESSNSPVQSISLNLEETSETNAATVNATVKTVGEVSRDMVVAVDVDGFAETLLYTNPDYSASTLGEFITDSGLDRNMKLNYVVRVTEDGIGVSKNTNRTVSDIDSLVKKYLLVEDAEVADTDAYRDGTVRVIIVSPENSTGSKVYFTVSNDGYVYIKTAIGYEYTFNIGKNNAEAFINAVTVEE